MLAPRLLVVSVSVDPDSLPRNLLEKSLSGWIVITFPFVCIQTKSGVAVSYRRVMQRCVGGERLCLSAVLKSSDSNQRKLLCGFIRINKGRTQQVEHRSLVSTFSFMLSFDCRIDHHYVTSKSWTWLNYSTAPLQLKCSTAIEMNGKPVLFFMWSECGLNYGQHFNLSNAKTCKTTWHPMNCDDILWW